MLDIAYVNNVGVIAKNPNMTAINSAIEVDLTGQVCSDSIGTRMFSGFGGQVDFIRGAAEGFDGKGKPIIALASVTNKHQSKIVPTLKLGKRNKIIINTRVSKNYKFVVVCRCWCCYKPGTCSICGYRIWYCLFVW